MQRLNVPEIVAARVKAFSTWAFTALPAPGTVVVYASMLRRILAACTARTGAVDGLALIDFEAALRNDTSECHQLMRNGPATWRVYQQFTRSAGLPVPPELPRRPRECHLTALDPEDRAIAERLRELTRKGLAVAYVIEWARWAEGGLCGWPGHQSELYGTWPNNIVPPGVLEIALRGSGPEPGRPPPIGLILRFDNARDLAFIRAVAPRAFPDLKTGACFGFDIVAARDRANRLEKNWIFRKRNGRRMSPRDAQKLLDQLELDERREAAGAAVAAVAAAPQGPTGPEGPGGPTRPAGPAGPTADGEAAGG